TSKLSLKAVTLTIQRWINSLKTIDGSITGGPAGFPGCWGSGFRPALPINVPIGVDRSRWPLWSYTRTFCQVASTTCLGLTAALISGHEQWDGDSLQTASPGPASPSKELTMVCAIAGTTGKSRHKTSTLRNVFFISSTE